ncbi:uncharacterized protein A1O9_03998 [Exophiala aquamarina CBS 119918]|uniref:Uncharacterized protein n=1 Tax=Exophiala aquamarina CBS 119918 TaxID=1182545 RepID=A0A072PG81_9EURO|nr:uncharacterized protein A1O9_03998 [Exophiala aquamarina CBS 119918]KEF59154.1 hypothetical protein A1O9_03998 [Exophiala aquamarina CBS 119918]
MPTRWLSIRKRNPLLHNSDQPDASGNPRPQGFDFAFTDLPKQSIQLNSRPVELPRPKTSGAAAKRKLRVEVPGLRPLTSDAQKTSSSQATNGTIRSQESSIGLAFGSPGHPPVAFRSPEAPPSDDRNSPSQHHPPGVEKALQMQSKRWKKFGILFKTRQALVRRDDIPPGPTIGLPTGFVVLDKSPTSQTSKLESLNQRTVPIYQDEDEGVPPPPIEKNDTRSRPSTATDADSLIETYARPPLPKLELDIPIPTPPFDRYSIMFKNVPANRSSSLLARRSKTLDSLKSFEDSRPTTKGGEHDRALPNNADPAESLTPLMPPRKLTTPTTKSPAGSKYSLFPAPIPTPVKVVGRIPFSETVNNGNLSQLKRSATSPARLSPMQDRFSINKPEPLNPKRYLPGELTMRSPEDNTASTDRSNPWSAEHSVQSSMSSNTTVDDIFFDIRAFRDSKGVEDGQFVMTRPDSVAVELARTRSKKATPTSHLREMQASSPETPTKPLTTQIAPPPPEPPSTTTAQTSAVTTKHTSVNTAYFDEAIAAVERLTSPRSATEYDTEKMLPIKIAVQPANVAIHGDEKAQTWGQNGSSSQKRTGEHQYSRLGTKSREDVSRLIPSPVAELKEDLSPKGISKRPSPQPQTQLPHQQAQAQSPSSKVISVPIACKKRANRLYDDSPTLPQGGPIIRPAHYVSSPLSPDDDKPPPVPEKDAKFIPLSRFAAKGTVTAIERTGITPQTRHLRSNTDTPTMTPTSVSGRNKERSATMPSSNANSPAMTHPLKSSLQGLEKTIPPRPNPLAGNPVQSNDVVAVARTVSLSRKQSARVHVPGPRLAARRAETHPQPAAGAKTPSSSHGRSGSKTGILGHRHRRSASQSRSRDKIKITKREVPLAESREKEKAMIKEARKWEILEKKSYSPVVVQASRGHKPGVSVGIVVENV